MKTILLVALVLSSLTATANRSFPRTPELRTTPGSLCQEASRLRYPEQIKYCERDVDVWKKEMVFIEYRKLGYSLSGERKQFKVDHMIPLCAGGSNELENLWPQYFTVSVITDPLEPLACEVLAMGKISQHDVVDLIIRAKTNLTEVPELMKKLRALKR